VVDGISSPVAGVTISATLGSSAYFTSTNASGNYTLSGFSAGTYTITASQTGYFFTPINLHVTVPPDAMAQNFTRHNTPPPSGDMVTIITGTFQMGCDSQNNASFACEADALPLHAVILSTYRIDKNEVTNAQYAQCVSAGACGMPSSNSSSTHTSYYNNPTYANYPVIYVNWSNANNYCAWIGKRLPSEAEWEKAARGSIGTRLFPWGDQTASCTLANLSTCLGDTNTVGSYLSGASPYGVLDMAGNVWEWVNDWYLSSYYGISPGINPPGPANGTNKVLRGGAWNNSWFHLRLAYRNYSNPNGSYNFIGFRCAAPP
jgi:formylglycine-generating enzyme required for sulfatase activity